MDARGQNRSKKSQEVIAIGSDHGGWELKEHLKVFLRKEGFHVEDFGCLTSESFDYPEIGINLSRDISNGKFGRGILICGTGIGMSIVANRFPGVRAALCNDIYTARMSREHNNANVLVLGGRVLGKGIAEEITNVWLNTHYCDPSGRHDRRLDQILKLEKEIMKRK
ncbi:ribose 5-phosphate isomerase B [bacterium]|nr:ribose 5-phosphate isomerase B [bacterium]